ncbi:MAG: hypothetical protein EZS28_001295 [Streblomastix strix]|uniref:Uncharacterized protein n=1 Tax=Streblomastix strix TaxID=222440 RepID=A0A5J4X9H3_9EUKA|nr:MAG: hypothetical protein EZS28_001295 [Streblomastix strix]
MRMRKTSINFMCIGERPDNNLPSNEELQVKLASILMTLCFVRKEEMANIDLAISIIGDEERTAEHFQQGPTDFIHLFQTENWEQADQRCINKRLKRLVQTLGIKGVTTNSIRQASSTELAAQRFDEIAINVFTHHMSDSKMNQQFYIFVANIEMDSIASALVNNHSDKHATKTISKQRGGARFFKGNILQQFPLRDDLQLSPQETLASPLSLPIISSQPIVEAESPNDHESAKVQNSQMQKDDQVVKPQEVAQNSSMTKGSDRATTANAQIQ